MFRITETVHHGDYFNIIRVAEPTKVEAIAAIVRFSPYYCDDMRVVRILSEAFINRETTATFGWADYKIEGVS